MTQAPSIRQILNWLAEARQNENLSRRDLKRIEHGLGLLLARYSEKGEL